MRRIFYFAMLPLMLVAENNLDKPNTEIVGMTPAEKAMPSDTQSMPLTLSIVPEDGSKLWLSDNSSYVIKPEDQGIVSNWVLTSAAVSVQDTKENVEYPLIITNNSVDPHQSVRAKFQKE